MRREETTILLSASDLSGHIACPHLTTLNLRSLLGEVEKPFYDDPAVDLLRERGMEFEQKYLEQLKSEGRTIHAKQDGGYWSIAETIEAMKQGSDVIYQASLAMGRWHGRADFLLKVSRPSRLGKWSYEVLDSKLAKETRTGTILQLCLYSEMVADVQGIMPESMYVITPEDGIKKHDLRLNDFLAYYRHVKRQLETGVATSSNTTYPLPCPHCMICDWWKYCDDRRRQDDHLSLVAGLSRSHAKEINRWQIPTLEKFAQLPLPLPKPSRGADETYLRLREQARVQHEARLKEEPVYECLEVADGKGLFKLPEPSRGDLFFDFEGDPFAGNKGLEYLFGWVGSEEGEGYQTLWAFTPVEEKAAFEKYIDMVMARWQMYPDMHVYHFGAYEPSALKRLMGKYGTREEQVDRMLRGGLFVDLHTATRQAIRAGIERYSLKDLEKFHRFEREMELRAASRHLRLMELFIERNEVDKIPEETKNAVAWYNKEDCISTRGLRNWLEDIRKKLIDEGHIIPRPVKKDDAPSEKATQHQQMVKPLFDALLKGVPFDIHDRSPEQHGRWLLAYMLDWYRREDKSTWWEYHRLREMPPDELIEEKSAIAYLEFTGARRKDKKSIIDDYTFPGQECEVCAGDELNDDDGNSFGKVAFIDKESGRISIRKGPSVSWNFHPVSVFSLESIPFSKKEESIIRLASWVRANYIDGDGPYRAGRDLLLRHGPRTNDSIKPENESPLDNAVEWVHKLDNGVLPIQGPPGSGKSYTAAYMILSLVKTGKKVGITALSHKVISNLLGKVVEMAAEQGVEVRCVRKVTEPQTPVAGVVDENESQEISDNLRTGLYNVAGGTAWLWSTENMSERVDVLFVDEAGQLSLIDTLAVSQGAKNLVLLGDPQQLKQPQQGSHPDGTEVSALEHVLGKDSTIKPEQGIFLDKTWRMHPSICRLVSELFYEERLHPKEGLEMQRIDGSLKYSGAGMWYEPVHHEANQSHSIEEVVHVKAIVDELLNGSVHFTNRHGERRLLRAEDIKVIAPYNLQVNELSAALPSAIQVGTVDRFQGQEAPVIIFSMATSSPEDAPRGMEFLYSMNRMNVAISRAKAVFILVASPRLFEPDCKTVEQMKLANVFCRFREVARG